MLAILSMEILGGGRYSCAAGADCDLRLERARSAHLLPKECRMIDWQTSSYIAAVVANAVTSIDKLYRGYADFFKRMKADEPTPEPDLRIQNKPDERAFVSTSLHTGATQQSVTYEALRARLESRDRAYVETLGQALDNYEKQWNAAFLAKSMASGMDVGRYDAQLDYLAKQIADPLLKVLDFVEHMGLGLDDHYLAARRIAKEYMKSP
jgi:hypothetical protein